jgi:hypothetical protein
LLDAIAETSRIGPTGARLFCREVQEVWPEVSPFFDERSLDRAAKLDLPTARRRADAPPARLTTPRSRSGVRELDGSGYRAA